ncbi:hypothetical protein KAV79_08150 [Candidatus Aerophobetes bacterium]|nr:hypothetical protein [Candidatus Aerophobetes bacterium]
MKKQRWACLLVPLVLLLAAFLCVAGVQEEVGAREVKLTAWVAGGPTAIDWFCDQLEEGAKFVTEELAAEGKDITIVIESSQYPDDWAEHFKKYLLACDAGEGPDIYNMVSENMAVLANSGYVVPFGDSVAEVCKLDPALKNVRDKMWDVARWHGKIWSVPYYCSMRGLWWYKPKLKAIGWSDKEIEALPEKIQKGEFIIEDMVAAAKKALDMGVIKKGFGFYHRPWRGANHHMFYLAYGGELYDEKTNKFIFSKDAYLKWYQFVDNNVNLGLTGKMQMVLDWGIWLDQTSHGEAIFWHHGLWDWNNWAITYVKDLGGEDYLFKNLGYTIIPSAIRGKPEYANSLANYGLWFVSSEEASGRKKEYTELVQRVIAKTQLPEINRGVGVTSAIGSCKLLDDDPEFQKNYKFLAEAGYYGDYAWNEPVDAQWGVYLDITYRNMLDVEQRKKTPEEAVEDAITLLKYELPDKVIYK